MIASEWERRQRLGQLVDELTAATHQYRANVANGIRGRNVAIGHRIVALEDEIREIRESLGIRT